MQTRDKFACPKCGGAIVVVLAKQDQARPDYEKQKLECTECGEVVTRTVDSSGRPVR